MSASAELKVGALEKLKPADLWPEPDLGLITADKAIAPALAPETLPAPIMDWCQDTAEACGAPLDYVVANLLGGASGWLGNARRVKATPQWIEPAHLWVANIGAPSTSKTPAARPFVEASREVEARDEDGWKQTIAAYERDTERAKARNEDWKESVRAAAKKKLAAPDLPIDAIPPEPPVRPRVLIDDATVQEIANILSGNPRGLLQVRDELSGWLGAMDQFSGAGSDRGFFLEAWNGGPRVIDRVKHGARPVRMPYCSLAICGGLQPDKLRDALMAADDGLAARFAYVWPEPSPVCDLKIEDEATAIKRRGTLAEAARRLRGLAMHQSERGEAVPVVLNLEEAAFVLLNELRRDALEQARAAHGLAAGWHGKTPARALRLALVIEHLEWAFAEKEDDAPRLVTAESMAHAGAYLDYLAAMFERVLAGLQIEDADSDAAAVARLLVKERPIKINERVLYQRKGYSFLRTKSRREAAFHALAEAGFIKPDVSTAAPGRQRGDWKVNPRLKDAHL